MKKAAGAFKQVIEITTLFDRDMLAFVGEITVRTESLAEIIDYAIWSIALRDRSEVARRKIGQQITYDLDLGERILVLKKLGMATFPVDTHEDWIEVMSKVKQSSTVRNKRVHALWKMTVTGGDDLAFRHGSYVTPTTPAISGATSVEVVSRHGRGRDKTENVTIETLRNDSSAIEMARMNLILFLRDRRVLPPKDT